MHVRAVVPLYPPFSLVGSWLTTHEFLAAMVERGHTVAVTAYNSHAGPVVHDGVTVESHFRHVGHPDVVVGHAGDDGSARITAERTGAPLVVMVHGSATPEALRTRLDGAALAVFPSQALADEVGWDGPSIVAHPPVDPDRYAVDPGDKVTLVNLSAEKGAGVFWACAKALPEVAFLGVEGGYGPQLRFAGHPNVTLQRLTGDMAGQVYARTRILLMPSIAETWGRVGLEAAASGIPTIAHPHPGVREALGRSAIYVDRGDIDGWVKAIAKLSSPVGWVRKSAAARQRAHGWWDHRAQLDRFATAVEEVAACVPSC